MLLRALSERHSHNCCGSLAACTASSENGLLTEYIRVYASFFSIFFLQGINHGDFNDLNVLVQPDGNDSYKITGILDFGDMNSGYFIYELAIAIMYLMIEHPKPLEVGGPVLAGWESVFPLNEAERECLFVLVLSRFCQSILLAHHSVTLHPENEKYLMITTRKGIPIVQQLWNLGREKVEKVWFEDAAQFKN